MKQEIKTWYYSTNENNLSNYLRKLIADGFTIQQVISDSEGGNEYGYSIRIAIIIVNKL